MWDEVRVKGEGEGEWSKGARGKAGAEGGPGFSGWTVVAKGVRVSVAGCMLIGCRA